MDIQNDIHRELHKYMEEIPSDYLTWISATRALLKQARAKYIESDRLRFYIFGLIYDSLIWTPINLFNKEFFLAVKEVLYIGAKGIVQKNDFVLVLEILEQAGLYTTPWCQ